MGHFNDQHPDMANIGIPRKPWCFDNVLDSSRYTSLEVYNQDCERLENLAFAGPKMINTLLHVRDYLLENKPNHYARFFDSQKEMHRKLAAQLKHEELLKLIDTSIAQAVPHF